jgi:hypothetical protein
MKRAVSSGDAGVLTTLPVRNFKRIYEVSEAASMSDGSQAKNVTNSKH